MNFYDWEEWVESRHDYWCSHIELYIESLPCALDRDPYRYAQPKLELVKNHAKWAGKYLTRDHVCQYAMPYCFMLKEAYEETIAHEVCHAYQQVLYPGSHWHGEMFLYLLRVVCNFPNASTKHNDYNPALLKALSVAYTVYQMEHPRDENN